MRRYTFKFLIFLCVLIIIVWGSTGLATYHFISTWEVRGTFGDMFGAINALFSGLAFSGVIYAIFLQRRDLELQLEALSLTREELKSSGDAQKQQVEQMKKTAELTILSSALNAYCQTVASSSPGGATHIKYTKKRDELLMAIEKLMNH